MRSKAESCCVLGLGFGLELRLAFAMFVFVFVLRLGVAPIAGARTASTSATVRGVAGEQALGHALHACTARTGSGMLGARLPRGT